MLINQETGTQGFLDEIFVVLTIAIEDKGCPPRTSGF